MSSTEAWSRTGGSSPATVRFEGDIVAGVAAVVTPELAREAAALVEVEPEPLPVVTDFEAALATDSPRVHPDWESYEGDEELGRHDNVLGFSTIVKGDVDAALAAADVVVRGGTSPTPCRECPSSRARSWRSGTATASRSGRRRRSRTSHARGSPARSGSPSRTCV